MIYSSVCATLLRSRFWMRTEKKRHSEPCDLCYVYPIEHIRCLWWLPAVLTSEHRGEVYPSIWSSVLPAGLPPRGLLADWTGKRSRSLQLCPACLSDCCREGGPGLPLLGAAWPEREEKPRRMWERGETTIFTVFYAHFSVFFISRTEKTAIKVKINSLKSSKSLIKVQYVSCTVLI